MAVEGGGDCVSVATFFVIRGEQEQPPNISRVDIDYRARSHEGNRHFILVENTNLHNLSADGRNAIVVTKDSDNKYHIGVCVCIGVETAAILQCNGRLWDFVLAMSSESPSDLGRFTELVNHSFPSNERSFWFVNLVFSPNWWPWRPRDGARNEMDGGFQMTISGPDTIPSGSIPASIISSSRENVCPPQVPSWNAIQISKEQRNLIRSGDVVLVRENCWGV